MTQLSSSWMALLLFVIVALLLVERSMANGSKKREFDYDRAPTCYPPGTKNPARVYVPYFNMDFNVNCHDKADFPDPFLVQCGLSYFGKDKSMSINYVMGPESMPDTYIPGDEHAPNWVAMGNIGKSQYAPNGFSFQKFTLQGKGSLRNPHVHGDGAEFCFIISGSALITITGLPQQDAEFRDPRYNLRRGENCHDEINHLWWLEDHYERNHKSRSNRHGGLRSSSQDGNDDDDDHDSSRHSHSKKSKNSKKSGSKHHSSSGDRHDHSDSHSHDYFHSATDSQSAHFHSDKHSHKGHWWDEWTERNCTRTTESQVRYSETFVLEAGDAFVIPVGYHHYVQEVGSEPLVGLSILDSVNHVTFDTPQVLKGLPKDVLTKSLGVTKTKLDEWLYPGKRRVYTDGEHENAFTGQQGLAQALYFDPEHLQFKIHGMNRNLIPAPLRHHHHHHRRGGGGTGSVQTRAVDANNHKVMENIKMSAAYTELAPGAILEPYWVDNADELLYVIEGNHIEIVRSPSSSIIGGRKGSKEKCKDVFIVNTGYLAIHEVGTTWFIQNKSEKTTAKLIRFFNSNMPSVTTLYDAYHSLPWPVFETSLYQ